MQTQQRPDPASNPEIAAMSFPPSSSPATEPEAQVATPPTETLPIQPDLLPQPPGRRRRHSIVKGLVIGVLSVTVTGIAGVATLAVLLPISSGCGSQAKHVEARQRVGIMNRAQQAYHLENQQFSKSTEALGIGMPAQTANYRYATRSTKTAVFNYGISLKGTTETRSYVGAVFIVPLPENDSKTAKSELTTISIVCQAKTAGTSQPAEPRLNKGVPVCGPDTSPLH